MLLSRLALWPYSLKRSSLNCLCYLTLHTRPCVRSLLTWISGCLLDTQRSHVLHCLVSLPFTACRKVSKSWTVCFLLNKEGLTLGAYVPPEQNPLSVFFENRHRIRARPVKSAPPSLVFLRASAAFAGVNRLHWHRKCSVTWRPVTPGRQRECAHLKFTAIVFSNVSVRAHKKPVAVIREPSCKHTRANRKRVSRTDRL